MEIDTAPVVQPMIEEENQETVVQHSEEENEDVLKKYKQTVLGQSPLGAEKKKIIDVGSRTDYYSPSRSGGSPRRRLP